MITIVLCRQLQSCKAYDSLLSRIYADLAYDAAILRQSCDQAINTN